MKIRSMTGFGKADVELPQGCYHIFMRGVNSKSLEVLFHNYPDEFVEVEEKVRDLIELRVKRGRIDVFFKTEEKFSKHKQEFEHIYKKIKRLEKELRLPQSPLKIADLLMIAQNSTAFKREKEERPTKQAQNAFISACDKALDQFLAFKSNQGRNLASVLKKLTVSLDSRLDKIIHFNKKTVANSEQQAVNVEEELALLRFYIKKLDRILFSQDILKKGKFLDFLSQEILRELNTLLSKLDDKNLCFFAIQMKVDLESIREQVQNIE